MLSIVVLLLGISCPGVAADFAIYAPGTQGDGVFREEVVGLEKFIGQIGWTSQRVTPETILAGGLAKFRGLIMPGGYAAPRIRALGFAGKKILESYVYNGGGYIGFCAGSYYASENFRWAEGASGDGGRFVAPKDYELFEGQPSLGLFPGVVSGPFGWTPWLKGAVATGLEMTEMNLGVQALKTIGVPHFTKLFYYGGPFFIFNQQPKGLEVWARSVKPEGTPLRASIGDGKPTIVHYGYGNGQVVLFSYHPVLKMPVPFPVKNSDPSPFSIGQINFQSLNILHAAMEIAAKRPVTPLQLH